jgi:staphylococcal nuclease domain-containing protein 1
MAAEAVPKGLPAIVKAVPSGDTLLVMGADSSRGPPPEKLISLTGITSPRLGNRNGTPDQPFAWAAREYLRKLCIGKPVTFVIESAGTGPAPGAPAGSTPREFGSVFLDGIPVQRLLVAEGWAKLKGAADEEMAALQAAAERAQVGLHNEAISGSSVRAVQWAGTFDVNALLERHMRKPVQAVIEQVGASLFSLSPRPGILFAPFPFDCH